MKVHNFQNNVTINGTGNIASGTYDTITVCGTANLSDNINAQTLSANGSVNIGQNVNIQNININGNSTFSNSVACHKFIVNGGSTLFGNKLDTNELHIKGSFEGKSTNINANKVIISGHIYANSIITKNISISPQKGFWKLFKNNTPTIIHYLKANKIHIQNAIISDIDGKEISIGPNCKVKNVTCNGSLQIHPKANVKNISGNYTIV